MDTKIDGNPSKSEVIGRCGGDEKTNHHAESTQSNIKNNNLNTFFVSNCFNFYFVGIK